MRTSFAALGRSFGSPDIAKALAAYLAFTITEWAAFIALIVYAYEDGGSVMVGLVSLLQLIPAALIAPVGSVLGDRHRRERVLLYSYASLSATTTLAAVALLTDAPAPLVYASATTAGWMVTLVRPTHASLLPRLARTPEELSSAYAASSLLESVSILLGPLLAGGLMASRARFPVGIRVVDAALAAMLLLGTVSVAAIRVRTEPAKDGGTSGVRVVATDAVEGVRAVARDRRSLLLVATMGLATVQLGFVDVLIVVLAFDVVGTGDAGVGFLTASIGVGAVVGAMLAVGVAARWRASRSFRWGSPGADSRSPGSPRSRRLAGVFLAMGGVGGALADVNGRVMLQRLIPDKQLSRAFGVLESVYMAGEGAGSFIASLIIVAIGPGWTLLIAGVLLPAVALLGRRAPHRAGCRDRILRGDGAPPIDAVLRSAPHPDARATREEPRPDPCDGRIRRDQAGEMSAIASTRSSKAAWRSSRAVGGRDVGAGRIVRGDRLDPRRPPDRDRGRHDREQAPGARSGRVPPGDHRTRGRIGGCARARDGAAGRAGGEPGA